MQPVRPAETASHLPDSRGLNVYRADTSFRSLMSLYLPDGLRAHLEPHLDRLGGLVTTELDDLAHDADRHPPVLHHRDRQGRDWQWVEKHPSYVALERMAFGELGLAAMSHRAGVLDWPEPLPPAAKYALTYLFVQSEFGLCCPVSMTDSLTRVLRRFGEEGLVERFLPALTATDLDSLAQGAMFMTEQGAGSDVGASTVTARRDGEGRWRLHGDKWFCSNADAALAMVLARPEGAPDGTKGLGLFLMPATVEGPDGTPEQNAYRIVRLKDKLGTRSMASGEIRLEGALAYPVGEIDKGFKQMAEMINVSRLSNGVRATGLMRRALTEALCVARGRFAFGKRLDDLPLMRRQLLKMLVPTEQALSVVFYTADALARADAGDEEAAQTLRILTPLIKFRACRDARKVTGDSMEVRGGCGYIEEWVNPRLLRDAHLGSIWEGTSNIIALDVLRAARKAGAHRALADTLSGELAQTRGVPDPLRGGLNGAMERALDLVDHAARADDGERLARQAASGLYNVASAMIMAREGAMLSERDGDAGRLMLARMVLDHRLSSADPLAAPDGAAETAAWALLSEGHGPVTPEEAKAFCTRP